MELQVKKSHQTSEATIASLQKQHAAVVKQLEHKVCKMHLHTKTVYNKDVMPKY